MNEFTSFVQGGFLASGSGSVELLDASTEEIVALARTGGFDAAAVVEFARKEGQAALAAMSFAERGELLGKMAAAIHEARDALIDTSVSNGGTTRGGAKFDIDGAAGTLGAYAELAKELPDSPILADGEGVGLGRGARLHGRHVYLPRGGVAVFINAFNFPAWGFAEKAATALLAGMPVICKPATATSWTAAAMMKVLADAGVVPPGVVSMLHGSVTEVLHQLGPLDVVAFTGSSDTAAKIRGDAHLVRQSVAVNVEADSLNAAVLGGDVDADADVYALFVRDVVREMTEKTGQKCTATRRLVVPEGMVERVAEDVSERLRDFRIGNPQNSEVTLGPLATGRQRDDVHGGMDRLRAVCDVVMGENRPSELIDVAEGKGFFAGPTLFVARTEQALDEVHAGEVFGPVASILPYDGSSERAVELVAAGGGMLVSSVYSDRRDFLHQTGLGIGPYCGRVVIVDSKAEGFSLPTGMVLPQLLHGGPGRAGGGEELGGIRGVQHYLHRAAFQGSRAVVEKLGAR